MLSRLIKCSCMFVVCAAFVVTGLGCAQQDGCGTRSGGGKCCMDKKAEAKCAPGCTKPCCKKA